MPLSPAARARCIRHSLIVSYTDPWFAPDSETARLVEAEARREIAPGHELHGLGLTASARCSGCDSAVFRCSDETFAIVHLTGTAKAETPPWPTTTRLGSFLAVDLAMAQHQH